MVIRCCCDRLRKLRYFGGDRYQKKTKHDDSEESKEQESFNRATAVKPIDGSVDAKSTDADVTMTV